MKRTIIVLLTMLVVFVAVVAVLVLRPVAKVRADHHGCSEATLSGNYGLVATGFYNPPGAGEYVHVAANFSMLATFDGKGGLTFSYLNIVLNGVPESGNPYSYTGTGATYTVLPNCTCTVTIPASATPFDAVVTAWGIVVDTGGDELSGNLESTAENIAGTFDAKRVAEGK